MMITPALPPPIPCASPPKPSSAGGPTGRAAASAATKEVTRQSLSEPSSAPPALARLARCTLRHAPARANIPPVSVAELWRRGQVGWPRSFPVAQAPNPPLLLAFAGRMVAGAANGDGRANKIGRSLFALGFGVWAWQETTSGANWFRRLLGLGALGWLLGNGTRRQ